MNLAGTENDVSFAYTSIAIGTIVGSISFNKYLKKITNSNLYISWLVYGFIFLITAFVNIKYLYFVLFFLGFVGAYVDILIITLIQNNSDKSSIGKNFGLFSTFANSAEAFSGVLGGILASISIFVSIVIMSMFIIIISLIFFN